MLHHRVHYREQMLSMHPRELRKPVIYMVVLQSLAVLLHGLRSFQANTGIYVQQHAHLVKMAVTLMLCLKLYSRMQAVIIIESPQNGMRV